MSPQGGQDPGQIAQWIATGQPSRRAVLRALGEVLMAVADHEAAVAAPELQVKGEPMNDRATSTNAASTRARFVAPALPPDASTDDIALWLADTRTRAHQLIDESVTAAQELLNQRAAAAESGDSTAQAQRHAQRLAIERLRRAVADLTLEVRGVHGRLDRMEALMRRLAEAPAAARATSEAAIAIGAARAAHEESSAALEEIEQTTLPAITELTSRLTASDAPDSTAPIEAEPTNTPPPVTEIVGAQTEVAASSSEARIETEATTAPPAVTEPASPLTERPESELPARIAAEPAPAIEATNEPARDEPATLPAQAPPRSDARAAVEAAVASALQEARRAASESAAPRVEAPLSAPAAPRDELAQPEGEAPASPSTPAMPSWMATPPRSMSAPAASLAETAEAATHAETSTPAPAIEVEERPLAWSSRPATPEAAPVESPRAVLNAPETTETPETTLGQPPATAEHAETPLAPSMAAPATPASDERTTATGAPTAEPTPGAARPGLWVPPSAIAPPRAVPTRPAPPPAAAPAPEVTSRPDAPFATDAGETEPAGGRGAVQAPTMAPARPLAATERASEPARRPVVEETDVFFPDGGPVILRIAPISGFQGLMRVQDSVVQLAAVREATVEAYARGEARLRLQLVAALEPDALSEALSASLGMRAGLQSVSDEERSIQIALG